MLRSELTIAGSNFIFDHIHSNYSDLLGKNKKLLVIFRGINIDYFNKSNVTEEKVDRFNSTLKLDIHTFKILLPGRLTKWKGQEMFLEAINKVNIQLGHDVFIAVILGSEQGRDLYKKKLLRLVCKLL